MKTGGPASLYRASRAETGRVFDSIHRRYDLTNSILSLGLHHRWRKAACRALDVRDGDVVMDLATGTGACAREILRRKDRGLAIVAVDSSRKMLQEGRRVWARHPSIRLVLAEMEHLPFRERSFDRIALGFGIRNSWNPGAALAEMWRVTTVGGRLVILEFSEPSGDLVRKAYRFMLRHVLPLLGGWVTGDKGSYRYLGNTITGFGSPQALQDRMEANGWRRILWRRLSAGVVAVHTGERTA